MRKVFALATAALMTISLAVPVMAANDKNDVGVEFGPPIDGNTFVQSNQNGQGDLRLVVKLQKTRPDQSLYVEVWCGPTHAGPPGAGPNLFYETDFLTTNEKGNGNTGAFWIAAEDLAICGVGEHTGHVDVGGFSTTARELTAPFDYTVE